VGKKEGITATPSAVKMAIGKILFAVIAGALGALRRGVVDGYCI
jgi:hypothetical protein